MCFIERASRLLFIGILLADNIIIVQFTFPSSIHDNGGSILNFDDILIFLNFLYKFHLIFHQLLRGLVEVFHVGQDVAVLSGCIGLVLAFEHLL